MTSPAAATQPTQPPTTSVALEAPEGWVRAALEPPDLSQSPQIVLVDWRAWGPVPLLPHAPHARLVTACFEASTHTWTADAEPLALDKIAQAATSAALRIADVGPMHLAGTDRTGDLVSQRWEAAHDLTRTFLGFGKDGPVACFALCIDDPLTRCSRSIDGAHMVGELGPPPREGLGLLLAMAGVHHPRTAAAMGLAIVVLGATLAVATRRRPRLR